jgi:hypothetical protein
MDFIAQYIRTPLFERPYDTNEEFNRMILQ